MATSMFLDPLQFLRDGITKLESEINSKATDSLSSQQLVGFLHNISTMSRSLQQFAEKAVEENLRRANMPSRKQVTDLAESLRRVEDKLDQLLPTRIETVRPARTRLPAAAAPAAKTEAVAAAKPRRARSTRSPRS